MAVITAKRNKNNKKNCDFGRLQLKTSIGRIFEFFGHTDVSPDFHLQEIRVFQILYFWKKASAKKTIFQNFQPRFISHWDMVAN